MPAVSKKQQRFFGMVRAAQKGEGASSPEVAKVAASIKKKDAKDFASTKHKGLPEKKMKSFKEATEDSLRDKRMERGGVDGNVRYDKAPKFASGPKKKSSGDSMSAFDKVVGDLKAKYGDKAVMAKKKTVKKEEVEEIEEKKKGLWDNIHAKRKRGEKPAKPGDKDYPKTLNVEDVEVVDEAPKYDKEGNDKYDRSKRMIRHKQKKYGVSTFKQRLMTGADHNIDNEKKAKMKKEAADFWHPDPEKDRKLGGPGANQRAREDRAAASKPKSDPKKLKKGESYMDYAKRQKKSSVKYSPEIQKRLDAAKKKKEGLGSKIKRKLGLGESVMSFKQFIGE